jgi:hypothetical protein
LKAHLSEDVKVEMPLLNDVQVRKLFVFHAFGWASYVPYDFKVISRKVVVACDGLPLSLEVLGIFLKKHRNIEIWIQALSKLHETSSIFKANEDRLNSTFQIMYDNLPKKEKDMFLDISCFFCDDFFVEKGLKITTIIRIWDQHDLLDLEAKSFINITKNGIIIMHHQL